MQTQAENVETLFSRSGCSAVPVSAEASEIARKNLSFMLHALAAVGQNRVAAESGVSEATVSRWKDGEMERLARLLTTLGLQVLPLDWKMYPTEEIDALLTLTRARLNGAAGAREFFTGV